MTAGVEGRVPIRDTCYNSYGSKHAYTNSGKGISDGEPKATGRWGYCSRPSRRCAAFVPMQMCHSRWVSGPTGEVDKLSSNLSSQTPQVQRL